MTSFDVKDCLSTIWRAGVDAVSGQRLVAGAMQSDLPFQPDIVIAAGKAASSMCIGALSTAAAVGNSIVATKYGHVAPELSKFANVTVIEAGHPIPDRNSLLAGETILNAVQDQHQESRLLLLLSGGASALVEVLPDELELGTYRARTEDMIAAGMPIDEINDARKKASLIKGGKLLREFKGNEIRVYAISDVKGDDVAVIGSGLGDGRLANCAVSTRIVGSNAVARQFALDAAVAAGLTVRCNEESLYHDVFELAPRIARTLCNGAPGFYIWGGEPTIRLPSSPGRGGRNQSLALAIARKISGRSGITVLVAGSDGTDGPTDAAGAIIDGSTVDDIADAERALLAADAGSYLQKKDGLFITGPTNTNVMDLVVALVQ